MPPVPGGVKHLNQSKNTLTREGFHLKVLNGSTTKTRRRVQ